MEQTDKPRSVTVSTVELAKRLKGIKGITDDATFDALKERLMSSDQSADVERVIRDLSQEDEFALICRLMQTATHLVAIDQNPVIKSRAIAPDFLGQFRLAGAGEAEAEPRTLRCFIEVKSTTKDAYKIKGSLLRRRREFAQAFELPLIFAVRFVEYSDHAAWVLVKDDDPSQSSITIALDHLVPGIRDTIWDDYCYALTRDDISFERIGPIDPQAGEFGTFRIIDEAQILEASGIDAALAAVFFSGFKLEEIKGIEEQQAGKRAFRPRAWFVTLLDLLYHLNRIMTDENGQTVYQPARILATVDHQDEELFWTRETIEAFTQPLLEAGILQVVRFKDLENVAVERGKLERRVKTHAE